MPYNTSIIMVTAKEKRQRRERRRRRRTKARRAAKIAAAYRAYQDAHLYLKPPVFGEHDERRITGEYGVVHIARTATKIPILTVIASYLPVRNIASLSQTQRSVNIEVDRVLERIARHIHYECFSRADIRAAKGPGSWGKLCHNLVNDQTHKILIMGGFEDTDNTTNRIDMMVIDNTGTNISWQSCVPMLKNRFVLSANYRYGQVQLMSASSYGGRRTDDQCTREIYDVLSQRVVELKDKLPIPNLENFAVTELDGKMFVIGGMQYDRDPVTGANYDGVKKSNRVFCLDINLEQLEKAGTWIEQKARLITARDYAAAVAYQGKLWLVGGSDQYYHNLSSVEVFDPLVGSWQAAGNLTKARNGSIDLFVIDDALFAAFGDYDGMRVEKRDEPTGTWQVIAEHYDGFRHSCALAACGSIIYFFGGGNNDSNNANSWNSFDIKTSLWASQYQDEATRQLPRYFRHGQAVCITPVEQLANLAQYAPQLVLPDHN